MSNKRIAIIGAGPVGVECGVLLAQRGHDVTVYERGAPGAHVARWAHVRFFSPWDLNRSRWGVEVLADNGRDLPDGDAFPTGGEYLQSYLRPLTEVGPLAGRVEHLTEVTGISRRDVWKGDYIGTGERGDHPFLLSVSGPDGERWDEADIVFDASGVYTEPGALGPGGLPAIGERSLNGTIERWIPDPLDRDRKVYANQRVLVVGDGYSAATSIRLLHELREKAPDTVVHWLFKTPGEHGPFAELDDDPLPQRLELAKFGNEAATGTVDGIEPISDAIIERIEQTDHGLRVRFDGAHDPVEVDRIVSNVGYRPDMKLTRELQVHHCYASEGPMKLAASLLAQSGSADCLAQESGGVDTLRSPEPNFYVVGAKSYGRNSNFLLRIGFEQIEAIADTLES